MSAFLELSLDDQRDAYAIAAPALRRNATSLEKDVWVCWVLEALFTCPGMPPMAFKGGTSLSKAYGAIARFSEDVDVTMDGRGLLPGVDPFDVDVSGKKRKKRGEELIDAVRATSLQTFLPYLEAQLTEVGDGSGTIRQEDEGATLVVEYPSSLTNREAYYSEGVKIEFGGRNMTEPHQRRHLVPYIASEFPDLEFVTADVDVLAGERTFWEKVTLAHAESSRPEFRASSSRMSRHWYDLAVLAGHDIGVTAMGDLELLRDVVKVKTMYFHVGHVEYADCLAGKAKLLPDTDGLDALRRDYEAMVAAGMLDQPLTFDEVMVNVSELQDRLNSVATTDGR